jgi:hypothetical protein
MFPLDAVEALRSIGAGRRFGFVGCASFEPRWTAFADRAEANALTPSTTVVLFPHDTGSAHEIECTRRQEEGWQNSAANAKWSATRVDVAVLEGTPWQSARDALAKAKENLSPTDVLVVDVTTMPRMCFYPLLAAALRDRVVENLLVVYSQPEGYNDGNLETEPSPASIVPPFDNFPVRGDERTRISWIPILGFGPHFATTVYDSLVDTYDLAGRVFPLIGFPAYHRNFFDRVLSDSGRVMMTDIKGSVRDQILYSAAIDPFDTRDTILRLVRAGFSDVHWIGSPMGPKPMAVGMLLAALEAEMTIIISPARTYHPDYSFGFGKSFGYVLKMGGKCL